MELKNLMEGTGDKFEEISQKVAQNKEKKNELWRENRKIKASVQKGQYLNNSHFGKKGKRKW